MNGPHTSTGSFRVKDRHFVQQGNQWIEVAAARLTGARRIRVRFDSREYFELIIKHPAVLPFMAHSRNVQLALDGDVYEIFE